MCDSSTSARPWASIGNKALEDDMPTKIERHSAKPFICEHCKETFRNEGALHLHRKERHR